jgi:hypothetical protein
LGGYFGFGIRCLSQAPARRSIFSLTQNIHHEYKCIADVSCRQYQRNGLYGVLLSEGVEYAFAKGGEEIDLIL